MKPFLMIMALVLSVWGSVSQAQTVLSGMLRPEHLQILKHYNRFVAQGVPEPALKRSLDFFFQAYGRKMNVQAAQALHVVEYKNDRYMVIIDYSLPSTEKRLYLLNLTTGDVERHLVAHGAKSGRKIAKEFSNVVDSNQTSLGFYMTGTPYVGRFGLSLKLYGLESSNDKAFERFVVMHGAWYVSEEHIKKYGRLGLSLGCPALERSVAQRLIPLLKTGTLIYAYHKDLAHEAILRPNYQVLDHVDTPDDTPEPTQEELDQVPEFFY